MPFLLSLISKSFLKSLLPMSLLLLLLPSFQCLYLVSFLPSILKCPSLLLCCTSPFQYPSFLPYTPPLLFFPFCVFLPFPFWTVSFLLLLFHSNLIRLSLCSRQNDGNNMISFFHNGDFVVPWRELKTVQLQCSLNGAFENNWHNKGDKK